MASAKEKTRNQKLFPSYRCQVNGFVHHPLAARCSYILAIRPCYLFWLVPLETIAGIPPRMVLLSGPFVMAGRAVTNHLNTLLSSAVPAALLVLVVMAAFVTKGTLKNLIPITDQRNSPKRRHFKHFFLFFFAHTTLRKKYVSDTKHTLIHSLKSSDEFTVDHQLKIFASLDSTWVYLRRS